MTFFAFIRHGETDWNRELRLQGSSDIPLNDTGRGQAAEAVSNLAEDHWDAIVSSPLSRARETAEIIARGLGIELGPVYDDLVERDYGAAEGATSEEIAERWPDRDYPRLEPAESVVARGRDALTAIAAEYGDDARVLVVCHGTLIRLTLGVFADRAFDSIINGSVSTFRSLADGGWEVLSVNGEVLAVAS
jgi:uncharacterized phosphatase